MVFKNEVFVPNLHLKRVVNMFFFLRSFKYFVYYNLYYDMLSCVITLPKLQYLKRIQH